MKGLIMKNYSSSRFPIVLKIVVALSLLTSILTSTPTALADMTSGSGSMSDPGTSAGSGGSTGGGSTGGGSTAQTTYTITYDGNGNTGGSVPSPTTGSSSVPVANNTGALVKTGYTFSGWLRIYSTGVSVTVSPNSSLILTSNIILHAVWTAIVYTITYIGNSNTGGTAPPPVTTSGPVALATNTGSLVRLGYTFNGWNTQADGLGFAFAMSFVMNPAANLTLYASWYAPSYTITYIGNGNTSGTAPSPTIATGWTNIANNTGGLALTGSTFEGWNTLANGSGYTYIGGTQYTANTSITLYARWIVNHTITYIGNGNTGGSVPPPTVADSSVNVATNTGGLVKAGYTLYDWNTHADASGASYGLGVLWWNFTANATLYAIWTANTYTITYLGNFPTGGSVPSPTVGHIPLTVKSNTGGLVRTGYTFHGWSTLANGLGTPYAIAATYSLPSDLTLYAVWDINPFRITYNGNGNTSGTVPGQFVGIGSTQLAYNTGGLHKTGSNFGGWSLNSNGSGAPQGVGSPYTLAGNVTFYAIWNVIHTITYVSIGHNSGSVPGPTVGSGSLVLANNTGALVKEGSSFHGWNTSSLGTGFGFAVGIPITPTSNMTLYARWIFNVRIIYHVSGNTGGNVPPATVGASPLTVAGNTGGLVKTGTTFWRWNTQPNGGNSTVRNVGAVLNLTNDLNLYAQWH